MSAIARRQRQSYAKCRPRMQQCERGPNHRRNPIFLTKGCESARNNAEMALFGSPAPITGNQAENLGSGCHGVAERFEPFLERTLQGSSQFVAPGGIAIERRPPFDKGAVSARHAPISDQRGGAEGPPDRLKFVAMR